MSNSKIVSFNTPVFRVSYPFVFEPRLNEMSKKMEYSVVALFEAKDTASVAVLKKAMTEVLLGKFGTADKIPANVKLPLKDGNTQMVAKDPQKYSMYKDMLFCTLKSSSKPAIRNAPNTDYITTPEEFYAGCYARARVQCSYWEHKLGGKGVNFYLAHLQKVRDGESFMGRMDPEKCFDALPASSMDDAGSAPKLGLDLSSIGL